MSGDSGDAGDAGLLKTESKSMRSSFLLFGVGSVIPVVDFGGASGFVWDGGPAGSGGDGRLLGGGGPA